MKTKSKNGFQWGTLRFVGVWVMGYIAVWVVSLITGMAIANSLSFDNMNINVFFAMLALGPTYLQAIVQKWVTRRGLNRDMRGWIRASVLGAVGSALLLNGIQLLTQRYPSMFWGNIGMYVFLLAWLVPPALAQAWLLRRYVKGAWLWAGAAIANALLFTVPMQWTVPSFRGVEYLFIAIIALMMGVVSGGVMRHLWTQPKTETFEKAKYEDGQEDDFATPERLQVADEMDDEDAINWQSPVASNKPQTT